MGYTDNILSRQQQQKKKKKKKLEYKESLKQNVWLQK